MGYRNGKLWSKFYWKDWQTDKKLRMCSIGARGLWMEMLCIMHDSEPFGHLTMDNGQPMSDLQLAILANVPVDLVEDLIPELLKKGVCSKDENGVLYCRRMIVEKQRSDVGKAAIQKRWNNPKRPKSLDKKGPITKADRVPYSRVVLPEAEAEEESEAEASASSERARQSRSDQAPAVATLGATRRGATQPAQKIIPENNPDGAFDFPPEPPFEEWH